MLKKLKDKVWQRLEEGLKKEFEVQVASLRKQYDEKLKEAENERKERFFEATLAKKQLDVAITEQIELKQQVEKANEDLRTQIKLIEAKARPDNVWVEAFTAGFNKAWDMMTKVIGNGFERSKELLITETKEKEQAKLDKMVNSKIDYLNSISLKEKKEVLEQRDIINDKLLTAEKHQDKALTAELNAMLKVVDWILKRVTTLCIIGILLFTPIIAMAEPRVEIVPAHSIFNGRKTTTAGTQVQLSATSVPIVSVTIKALSTNTGIVYVGDSSVDSTNGRELQAGEAIDIDISNLNLIWIDVSVTGEGVSYSAIY
jgi:hypothetical protein